MVIVFLNLIGKYKRNKGIKSAIIKLMTTIKDQSLLKAFKRFNKRYLAMAKKPDIRKLLPEDLYHTMRLEGEKITKKQAQALFR